MTQHGTTGFELFDHTADVGIRVWAPTRPQIIAPATEALYAVIGELAVDRSQNNVIIDVTADGPAFLLRDYLARVLLLFERDGCILTPAKGVEFSDRRLVVRAEVHTVDTDRSVFFREAKAVTYHDLTFHEEEGKVEAKLVVDI